MMKKMKMKNNYILIKEIKEEPISTGGIILPTNWNDKRKAKVVSTEENGQVKEGDTVLIELGKSTEIQLDNEAYQIIHLNNIMMVI